MCVCVCVHGLGGCVCVWETRGQKKDSVVPSFPASFPSLAVQKSSSFFVRTQGEPGNEASPVSVCPSSYR